jgi:purine-binding chemotaxis protein CheW
MAELRESAGRSSSAQRFLTFRLGERRYALPAAEVTEVVAVPAMTRVPQSPAALLGIANLRGAVLPIASLRGLLGVPEEAARRNARAIVLNVGASVALVVDAVDALEMVEPGRIEARQAELGVEAGERVNGAFQTGKDGAAAKILDIKALLEAAFAQRSRAERRPRGTGVAQGADHAARDETARPHEMLVTFEVAGQEFALDLDAVQEVLPAVQSRAAIPRAEAVVLGVTSLRGALLPLLSLRALLGFPMEATQRREKVVVMNVGGAQVGLVADAARAVVAAEEELIDPVPTVLAARLGGESRIRAIYRGDAGKRLISILAPDQLFREDVMQRLRAQHGEKESRAGEAGEQAAAISVLVFRLGEDEFALPIDAVDEVAHVPAKITRLPKTPKFLEGVVNLRGEVVPVVDLRRRFDMPKGEDSKRRRLVVVRTERHRAGLIVDSVSDVLRIPETAVGAAPDLTDDIAVLVRGVINLGEAGRIVLLLDPPELLTRAERGLLDQFQVKSAQENA